MKVRIVRAMVFPVVMYGSESWTIKKAECWRIDAFELFWRRIVLEGLLRFPWTAKRSNQPIIKEINPEYSLKRLMLKLKLQCFGHLMQESTHWKRPWCWERQEEKGTIADKILGWYYWLNGHELCKVGEIVRDREAWHAAVHGIKKG